MKKLITRLGKAAQWGKSLHISMGAQVQIASTHEKHLCVLVALMLKVSGRQMPEDPASKKSQSERCRGRQPTGNLLVSTHAAWHASVQITHSSIHAHTKVLKRIIT